MPVGLNLLIYGDVFHWGQLMAASVITTIPVVALYMFIHRWMVEGLAAEVSVKRWLAAAPPGGSHACYWRSRRQLLVRLAGVEPATLGLAALGALCPLATRALSFGRLKP